jgi:NRAMP (natural resistance-associated macrophage protein)-like metal ion transporter
MTEPIATGTQAEQPAPPGKESFWRVLGPGLITGASDDDPSGIATYSQAGARFGFALTWTLLFSWPLMCAIQEISARIGRVTGHGLAGNLARHYPRPLVLAAVGLLLFANTVNIGANLGAMGAAVRLVIGGPAILYVVLFAAVIVVLEIYLSYKRSVAVLKWLTLALFSYVAVALSVDMPWGEVGESLLVPTIAWTPAFITMVVAILGTTISPYLFFWQAEEVVEDIEADPAEQPLSRAPGQAVAALHRIRLDTWIGMGLSNVVALFIIITCAATLHASGDTDIDTAAQAAEALQPIAGDFAFLLFALGIVGTGLLSIPVLAGSAAYALGEVLGWPIGLARKARQAKAFYATVAAAVGIGGLINLTPIDPIDALIWSAVVNGVVAVPVMVLMMLVGSKPAAMGDFTLPPVLRAVGWLATGVMGAAVAGMFATL